MKLDELLEASDEALVKILREGTDLQMEQAATVLYDRYFKRLNRFAHYRGIPPEEALQIAQEALFRALVERLASFEVKGEGSFRRWIYTITRNLVADYRKKLINQLSVSLDKCLVQGQRFPAPCHPLMEKAKLKEHLEAAGLNPTECEIVELTYVYSLKPADIEIELGIPAEEVSRILYRVKQKLKQSLH